MYILIFSEASNFCHTVHYIALITPLNKNTKSSNKIALLLFSPSTHHFHIHDTQITNMTLLSCHLIINQYSLLVSLKSPFSQHTSPLVDVSTNIPKRSITSSTWTGRTSTFWCGSRNISVCALKTRSFFSRGEKPLLRCSQEEASWRANIVFVLAKFNERQIKWTSNHFPVHLAINYFGELGCY